MYQPKRACIGSQTCLTAIETVFSAILEFENPFEIRKGTKHSHLLLILFEALMVPLKVSLLHAYFPGSACYSFKLFFRLIQSPFLV